MKLQWLFFDQRNYWCCHLQSLHSWSVDAGNDQMPFLNSTLAEFWSDCFAMRSGSTFFMVYLPSTLSRIAGNPSGVVTIEFVASAFLSHWLHGSLSTCIDRWRLFVLCRVIVTSFYAPSELCLSLRIHFNDPTFVDGAGEFRSEVVSTRSS